MTPKNTLTHRERMLRFLKGEKPDRAPFPAWLGMSPWSQTLQRWKEESGVKDLDIWNELGFDPGFQNVQAEFGPYPHFREETLRREGGYIIYRDRRGIVYRAIEGDGTMPEFLDYPVKSPADWERFRTERLGDRLEERLAPFREFLKTYDPGLFTQLGSFPWGIFGTPRDFLGAEEFLVSFRTEPEMIREMMNRLTDLWLLIYEAILTRIQPDMIHIWEDMSDKNGPLISPRDIEEFMMPCYDRIAAFAKSHAIPFLSVDSDGNVEVLLEIMARHGVNAFMPFECQAGSDIVSFGRRYPGLVIMGGLDKNALADDADPGAINRELNKAEKMLARGRYLPGCDHLIPPNVSWKRWKEFVQNLKKMMGL